MIDSNLFELFVIENSFKMREIVILINYDELLYFEFKNY